MPTTENPDLNFNEDAIGLIARDTDELTDESLGEHYLKLAAWKKNKALHFKSGGFKAADEEDDSALFKVAKSTPVVGKGLGLAGVAITTKRFFGRIWDSGKNLLSNRKVRSNLIKLGVGALAIAGMVSLCVFFPPAGAMVAAVGGTLTFGVAGPAIAFAVGTAVAGVVAGSIGFKIGEALSKNRFKSEKYELNLSTVSKFKKEYNLDEKTVSLMNRYLVNRIASVNSALYKQDLTNLHDMAIQRGEALGVYQLNRYFCNELTRLMQEENGLEKYENDIKALEYFLKQLSQVKGYVRSTVKGDIDTTLELLKRQREKSAMPQPEPTAKTTPLAPLVTLHRPMDKPMRHKVVDRVQLGSRGVWMPAAIPREGKLLSRQIKAPMSKGQVDEIDAHFQQHVDQYHQELGIEKITRQYNANNMSDLQSGRRSVEYHFETKDNITIPPLTKEESKNETDSDYTISTYMDLKKITPENRQKSIEILAIHAKSFMGPSATEITIHNVHDDDFVVDLAVAMIKHGIKPELEQNFDNREELIRRIEAKSQSEGPAARASSRMG